MGCGAARQAPTGRNGGFTLIEMLIVASIFSIMVAITVPYFLRETPGEVATRAAYDLEQVLRLARYRAISQNRPVYVSFEPGSNTGFYTVYVDLDDPATTPSGTPAEIGAASIPIINDVGLSQRGVVLPDGLEFATGGASSAPGGGTVSGAFDLPSNPLVFNSRGMVNWGGSTLTQGTIFINHATQSGQVRAVTVGRTGIVKSWRHDGGTWK